MSALWRLGYDAYGRAVSWREATPTEHAADITNNNEADAVILAAIGARLHGHPIDDIPKANLRSFAKLPRITDAA